MTTKPAVSVVIPTRDSVVQLRRCLASLADDQGTSFEVLVVDQGSTDGTQEVARAGGALVVDTPRPDLYAPPTRSRNRGAAAARGEYLLHLDADMALAPAILGTAVRACREIGHVALILEEVDVTGGFWADCKALERQTYRAFGVLEGARFVRTDVFRTIGGYDEALGSGEDWDVHARYAARGSVGRVPEAVYHYVGDISFGAQIRKKFTYGRSALAFLGKHRTSQFSRAMASAYLGSWRVLAARPMHAFGFVVLRIAEVAALSAGIGVALLERRVQRRSSGSPSSDKSGATGT